MPTMPAWDPSPLCVFCVTCVEIGHASIPVVGSIVPAKLLVNGMLNMS